MGVLLFKYRNHTVQMSDIQRDQLAKFFPFCLGTLEKHDMFSLPLYQVVFVFVFIPFRETGSYDVDFFLFFERIPVPTSTGIFGILNTKLSKCLGISP